MLEFGSPDALGFAEAGSAVFLSITAEVDAALRQRNDRLILGVSINDGPRGEFRLDKLQPSQLIEVTPEVIFQPSVAIQGRQRILAGPLFIILKVMDDVAQTIRDNSGRNGMGCVECACFKIIRQKDYKVK